MKKIIKKLNVNDIKMINGGQCRCYINNGVEIPGIKSSKDYYGSNDDVRNWCCVDSDGIFWQNNVGNREYHDPKKDQEFCAGKKKPLDIQEFLKETGLMIRHEPSFGGPFV